MPIVTVSAVQSEFGALAERCRALCATSEVGAADAVQHRCRRWAILGDAAVLCRQHRTRADAGFVVYVVPAPPAP